MFDPTHISPRLSRATAAALLHAYAALLLLMAMHHHQHGSGGPLAVGAVPAPCASHVHSAAECPLLYYAVSAFQGLPDRAAIRDVDLVRLPLLPEHPALVCCGAADRFQPRAPPPSV